MAKQEVKVPELGEGVDQAQITRILVRAGDQIQRDQAIIEAETGKATAEIPSPAAGTVTEIQVSEGDQIQVGDVLLILESTESTKPTESAESAESKPPPMAAKADEISAAANVPAAPSVRRFAREIGVDLGEVSGSGAHGRVSIADVKAHARQQKPRVTAAESAEASAAALPDLARWGPVTRHDISSIRRHTAHQMQRSWQQVPLVSHFDQADITRLEASRHRLADELAAADGGKLTLTPILVKVVATALAKFPEFKAVFDPKNAQMIMRQYTHIGIAVATDRGLLVPIIRDADRKTISAIAAEAQNLAAQARAGKLRSEDMQGGCFTITNLGGIGGSWFTPIVNWPESAILGVGRAFTQVALNARAGRCRNTVQLPLSLSYDHRLLDGAAAASFSRWIALALEEPLRLNLG